MTATQTNMTELRAAQARNAAFYAEVNEVTYARRRGEITKAEAKAKLTKVHAKHYGKTSNVGI
jgi:hypothetical protein